MRRAAFEVLHAIQPMYAGGPDISLDWRDYTPTMRQTGDASRDPSGVPYVTEVLSSAHSYLQEFDATVVDATHSGVVLDRTAFYPGGGANPTTRAF